MCDISYRGIRARGLEFESWWAPLNKIIAQSNFHICSLREPAHEGECWSISATFPHHLNLLG
jgi:hypothetical protein